MSSHYNKFLRPAVGWSNDGDVVADLIVDRRNSSRDLVSATILVPAREKWIEKPPKGVRSKTPDL